MGTNLAIINGCRDKRPAFIIAGFIQDEPIDTQQEALLRSETCRLQ